MRKYGVVFALLVSLAVRNAASSGYYACQDSAGKAPEANAQILLTVSDTSGNLAPLPPIDSVRLQIGGQPVGIEEIRSLKDSSLFFSVLVDISASSKSFAGEQIAVASKLFHRLSTGNNHGYLVLFKDKVVTSDRFVDPLAADEILKRFPAQNRLGSTALYDAIVHAATEQLSSPKIPKECRRAIFLLSDGEDDTSSTSLSGILKMVRTQGIPVFSIGIPLPPDLNFTRGQRQGIATLKTLSDGTGGWVAFLDEPGDFVGRVANLTSAQYLVLFKSPALKPGKTYPLKITSSVKGVRLLAPNEYLVP